MKLTPEQARAVEFLAQDGHKAASIAKRLGLTKSYVDEYLKSR